MNTDFGPCCACGSHDKSARNIICLHKKAPLFAIGWGCLICGLSSDGAIAVVCDDCLHDGIEILYACASYADRPDRIPISQLSGTHDHNPRFHTELAVLN